MASSRPRPCPRCGASSLTGDESAPVFCASCGASLDAVGEDAAGQADAVTELDEPVPNATALDPDAIAEAPTMLASAAPTTRRDAAGAAGAGPPSAGLAGGQPQSLIGDDLGGCRIERKIGQGGMGAVYLARHLDLDVPVAIKVILPHVAALAPSAVDRFLKEARAAARLQHPNIVGVMNTGEDNGVRFIVLQYVDGESIQQRLRRQGKLDVDDALAIAAEVGRGLGYAHEQGIVHRDIKPANVLISSTGEVKIADLGLAKRVDDDSSLTETGAGMGTPHYMAPEQALDPRTVDGRSDVYALGCMLFQMLTGRVPFDGPSSAAVLNKHINAPVPDARLDNAELPTEIAVLLRRMMAKDPAERHPSAAAATLDIERIQELRAGSPSPAAAAPGSAAAAPSMARRDRTSRAHRRTDRATASGGRRWMLIALGILVAVAAAWIVTRTGDDATAAPRADSILERPEPTPTDDPGSNRRNVPEETATDRDLADAIELPGDQPSIEERAARAARERADREQVRPLREEYQRREQEAEGAGAGAPDPGRAGTEPGRAAPADARRPPPRAASSPGRRPPRRHPPPPPRGAPPPIRGQPPPTPR